LEISSPKNINARQRPVRTTPFHPVFQQGANNRDQQEKEDQPESVGVL
jgi:hypothetical protein